MSLCTVRVVFSVEVTNARFSSDKCSLFIMCRVVFFEQIDTNSSVKREGTAGNASLSQLLLTSPFSSSDGTRFTSNDAVGQPSTHSDMEASAAPTGQV